MKNEEQESRVYFEIRPECKDAVPKTRFKHKFGRTLSARKWHASFSKEGYLDMTKVLRRIQKGGVHASIKGAVWEFLLGCFDPKSTFEEQRQLRQHRRNKYELWKSECKKLEPTIGSGRIITAAIISENGCPIEESSSNHDNFQEKIAVNDSPESMKDLNAAYPDKKINQWKQTLHQIGVDVVRTDRTLVFYENPANLAKLWDILAVYAWIDGDIGYCQGMSDFCSPMVILVENEADAFWCFERVMRRMRGNFQCTANSIGVRSQLDTLSSIMKTVDPKLHRHLENLDGGEYLFAFRMLMVLFRREFSFVDTLYLWELIWTMEYNPEIFASYESSSTINTRTGSKGNFKELKQYGKFERRNMKDGSQPSQNAFSVFLVAAVLEAMNKRLLKEAKGLDDVAKILNDISGTLDAKKACIEALKLHKKYLSKVKKS